MSRRDPLSQLSLFPDLDQSLALPSLSTLPGFERAVNNLIRLNDLGGFVSISVHGVEKSYSLTVRELALPREFLRADRPANSSPAYHLFPREVRQHLKTLTYDLKSFLTKKNSLRTPFGYFLFRAQFEQWDRFVEHRKREIDTYLEEAVGGRKYSRHFLSAAEQGMEFLRSIQGAAPWKIEESLRMSEMEAWRERVSQATIHTLDRSAADFPQRLVALKMIHFPLDLKRYLEQISIQFAYKSIHLSYLRDEEIRTLDDVKRLSRKMASRQSV